ncbi:hypothetical protein PVAND_004696 [Polypedilum vanderplanki]|uniref:Thioredoxin domain-containing protein n=1 Tax=Polypedilum vanderplanki TaxID=319348 RepID=A0A9J6BXQ6_POLVA|nr:hypothetical protein PVAND_004696 [Polypedilum vanderplanki]
MKDSVVAQSSNEIDPIISELGDNENLLETSSETSSIDKSNSSSIIMRIFNYGKELVLIFAFLLTTIATIQNNSPKISRASPPVPFFSRGSFVEDYYYGELIPTQQKVTLSELSFVFFYAPWSAECINSKKAYEHVSRLFYREANFFAINCWQPNSECRSQYNKISTWPILMAYMRNGFGIQYQRNLFTESALTTFINALLNPFHRVTTPDDLLELMTKHDCVIVAFIDIDTYPRHYSSFHRTALKFIERDPFNEVGFGIVLGESAVTFGVDRVPTLRAYLWNETIEYTGNHSWTSREIIKWINENIQQVSLRLAPPGVKVSSLAPYMRNGPVLILFTPRNFYLETEDSYLMMRQLGMEYYNCKEDEWVNEMAHDFFFRKRIEYKKNLKVLQEVCSKIAYRHQFSQDESKCKPSVSTISYTATVLNSSKNSEAKLTKTSDYCEIDEFSSDKCDCSIERACNTKIKHNKYVKEANSANKFITSMLDNTDDERSPEAIEKYNLRRKCEMLRRAEKKSDIIFIDDEDTTPLKLISGLACKSNQTFTLISMDSVNFHTFAERLGVDILEIENKTAAMIIDQENESTYLLDEPINMNSIAKFIYKFHRNGLERFLRTNSIQYKHTHFFDINEFLVTKKRDKVDREAFRSSKMCPVEVAKNKNTHVIIREIYSEDFDSVIKSNKTVIILFYSINCAFCSQISQNLLTVSRILEQLPNIEFARIDGDRNDLAWHYTMAEYPSLLIFPSGLKSDSRKFPSKMPITVPNILGFILANLNRSYRLLGLIAACNYKRQNSTNDCIVAIQEEITESISFALREWRKHSRKRSAILRIIKELKELYLRLFVIRNSCDFIKIEKDVTKLIGRWQKAMIF